MAMTIIKPKDPKKAAAEKIVVDPRDIPMPTFVVGDDRQDTIDEGAKAVLAQVNFRLDVKGDDRHFDSFRGLHEIPMLRMLYGQGGHVKVITDLAPGIGRIKFYTLQQFKAHCDFLDLEYTLKSKETGAINLKEKVYGEGRQFCLPEKMKEVYDAWRALEKSYEPKIMPRLLEIARAEYKSRQRPSEKVGRWEFDIELNKALNEKEVEEIISLINPEKDMLDELDLAELDIDATPAPTISMDGEKQERIDAPVRTAPAPAKAPKAAKPAPAFKDKRLSTTGDDGEDADIGDYLKSKSITQQVALDVALLHGEYPKGIPAAALAEVVGSSKPMIAKVTRLIAEFDSQHAHA